MSDFTPLIAVLTAAAIITWWRWYGGLFSVSRLASPMRFRIPILAFPLACLMALVFTLRWYASPDVREDAYSLIFYAVFGAAWLGSAALVFPLLGVSLRDDVVERHNQGAAWAVNGTLAGVTFCFAGANIGSGPGPEAVLFCAVLATSGFFLCWLVLELIARPSEAITVERDLGTGIRLGGFAVALGIVLGNAVAGSWGSTLGTLRDFLFLGWPALFLLAIATVVEKIKAVPAGAPAWQLRSSIGIALGYVAAAISYAALRGDWS